MKLNNDLSLDANIMQVGINRNPLFFIGKFLIKLGLKLCGKGIKIEVL